MKPPIRLKVFIWLAAALGIFILFQFSVWFLWEYGEYFRGEAENLRSEMEELLVILGINLFCLPFMLTFLWILSSRMLRPLTVVSRTAAAIGAGDLDTRIPVESADDELGVLASTVNQAFDRYQEANDRLSRFSADASHQLRTPLTALRSTGEVCLARERSPAEYRQAIESMLEDAGHLTGIVERLLLLSRLEANVLRKQFTRFHPAAMLQETVDRFQPLCADHRITLALDSDAAEIAGDPALLQQALSNLLDNAVRHTPDGGTITLGARDDASAPGFVELFVSDTGEGIPAELRPHLFERFSQDRNSRRGAAGLGLAIVAEIAKVHGGKALLDEKDGPGTRISILVPR